MVRTTARVSAGKVSVTLPSVPAVEVKRARLSLIKDEKIKGSMRTGAFNRGR